MRMSNHTLYNRHTVKNIDENPHQAQMKTFLVSKDSVMFEFILYIYLKVSKFQNEFMKPSFLPKYERKIVKISALTTQGRNPDNFPFVFWEK